MVSLGLIAGGIGALALAGLATFAYIKVDDHFDEYARLQKAETDLTIQRDQALEANKGLQDTILQEREFHAGQLARAGARADTERRNADAARNALARLRDEPSFNDPMSPVLGAAFDWVRQRRASRSGQPPATAPPAPNRGGASPVPRAPGPASPNGN